MIWSRVKDVLSSKYQNDVKRTYISKILSKHIHAVYDRNCLGRLTLLYLDRYGKKIIRSPIRYFNRHSSKEQLGEKLRIEFNLLVAKSYSYPIKSIHFQYHSLPNKKKFLKEINATDEISNLMKNIKIK